MTLPLKVMAACIALLSDVAPFCQDARGVDYVCIEGVCRTPAALAKRWRGNPALHQHDLEKLFGVKP